MLVLWIVLSVLMDEYRNVFCLTGWMYFEKYLSLWFVLTASGTLSNFLWIVGTEQIVQIVDNFISAPCNYSRCSWLCTKKSAGGRDVFFQKTIVTLQNYPPCQMLRLHAGLKEEYNTEQRLYLEISHMTQNKNKKKHCVWNIIQIYASSHLAFVHLFKLHEMLRVKSLLFWAVFKTLILEYM